MDGAANGRRWMGQVVCGLMLGVAAAVVGAAGGAGEAWACSLNSGMRMFFIEDGEPDEPEAFPEPPTFEIVTIKRGIGPQRSGLFGQTGSSCDDLGYIQFVVQGGDPQFGVLFEYTGELPEGLRTKRDELPVSLSETIVLSWIDGATDDQEPFDFTLTATLIDRYGRIGPTSQPLQIQHEGTSASGCSAAGGARPLNEALGVGVAVLGWCALRRRRPARRT